MSDPKHTIFAVPNGGVRSKAQAAKFKATGLIAGVSDLIIVRYEEVLFIEVKTETGTQSKIQKGWQKTVEALGFRYIIVRSVEDFWNKINLE